MKKSDVLILGGGPAGITFARTVKKLKPETSITMLRPEAYSMVYCAIPYAIEGLFEPSKVFKRDNLVTDVGVDLVQRAAVQVDLNNKTAVDDAGDQYKADVLFIATGASPIRPPIPGTDAENVFTVKVQQDMEAIIACIEKGARRAVVVGAGAIGIEQAQAYRTKGIETTLLDMAPQVLPAMLDTDMAEAVHETLRDKGIDLRLSMQVTQINTVDGKANGVTLADGQRIDLDPERDFICFAVGMRPDVGLFQDQGLIVAADGIVVDDHMCTNIPGIYAAGDCCAYASIIDGRPIGGKLATNAVPMAKIAARHVAGLDDRYPGFVNGAATCAYDLRIGSTGFTVKVARDRGLKTVIGYGETTTLFPMMPGAEQLKVKVVANATDLRIIGAQVISALPATDKVDVLTLAIQQQLTLKQLAQLSYSAQPWQSFFPARSAIVEACENALERMAVEDEESSPVSV